ncbi:hypothetical protein MY8738_005406 [Beauveria namnaoensis]
MLLWPSRRRVYFSWPGGGPLVGDRRRVREEEEEREAAPAGPDGVRGPSRPNVSPVLVVLVVRVLSGLSHSRPLAKLTPVVVGFGVPCPAPPPPPPPPPRPSDTTAGHHPPNSTMSDENLFASLCTIAVSRRLATSMMATYDPLMWLAYTVQAEQHLCSAAAQRRDAPDHPRPRQPAHSPRSSPTLHHSP